MRVTSDSASAIATEIAANTIVATIAVLVTNPRGASLGREGCTATTLLSPSLIATCYKVGLHSSHTGGGVMLNLDSIWPLSKKYRSVALQKTQL